METLAITDFQKIRAGLARVVISFTGAQDKESIRAALNEKLGNMGTAVEDSFRPIRAGVAVGFVRANTEIRVVDSDQELRASYRVLSSNIMMDNKDKTMWQVKEGAGGKYLARHDQEDLSELLQASVHRRTDIPRLAQIQISAAAAREFVSYVNDAGDLDHGFVVATNRERGLLKVMSVAQAAPVVVANRMVTSIDQVPVPKSHNQRMLKAGISSADKKQANEYWKQLYFYDQNYLDDVIRQVNEGTTA